MFLSSVSGGLVALGLFATATHLGTAFYAFALLVLPLLAFVGLVTFERTLQSGLEDLGYARRIARLRAYYFDQAPELFPYLLSVPSTDRLFVQGLLGGRGQNWRTVAGMVGVITAVLIASSAGLLAAVTTDHSLAAAVASGVLVFVAVLWVLMRYQGAAWIRANRTALNIDEETANPNIH